MPPDQLPELRRSLDRIDHAIVLLLAERFRATQRIGEFKRDHGLSPVDAEREAYQLERISRLAAENRLDAAFARRLLRMILDEVVMNHSALQSEPGSGDLST